ncbi:trypsin-like peptidase domain-containing protein [Silvibacterium dinghuense]|uniref:PDZ domain-containing protein n=1 Tax=Silvibacterium dinghuense TaxID=1560006 RepID=A0A4Q1SDS1_9BACT|nr:trypsin-like peptidase domain-containing protein [Silvibacterium dinghuense]RXS95058.1 PDZ domain-containing protein [Silvibacterium dinghuense]GGH10245.1 putative periplasmic serine endoprotease DegP-like protein [Silvibacterium dinghuense]
MKSLLGRLRYRRLASTFTILATLSAGILIGSIAAHGVRGQESSKVDTSDATPLKVPAPRDLSTDFTRIAKQVEPAVVNINTITLPKERQQSRKLHGRSVAPPQQQQSPDDGDDDQDGQGGDDQDQNQNNLQDFFNRFFGMGPQGGQDDAGQERESLGSGFIVDPRGYIITNNHVVDKADKIFVKLPGDPDSGNGLQGRPATVVGVDKDTDIAVIKIKTDKPLPTVNLGNSDGAQVGDWVIAIGSPFTLSQTVTAGIVSAKNRTIDQSQAGQFQHFIQTDAAINPGNSGGPLLNMAGEVIGMNTAIFTQSGTYAGIGFAMPANVIVSVYNQLISPEHKVIRGSIGITFQPSISPAVARVYGFKNGVMINTVQSGFPADKAGLKPNDIITSIDGRSIKDGNDLVDDISARKPGTTVTLGYLRDGKSLTATVTIGDRAKMIAAANSGASDDDDNSSPSAPDAAQAKLGLQVSDIPQGAPAGLHGVVIENVKPGSFADEAGLGDFQGFVIVAVNRQPVHSAAEFGRIVAALKSGSDVAFEVVDPQHRSLGSHYVGGTLP